MTADLISILNGYGASVTTKIKQNLQQTGTNATGKTSASLKYKVTTEGTITRLQITGRPYFMAVETGRGPTINKSSTGKPLGQAIREWMKAKGLSGSPYGIARAIHEKGTKLYRKGGRKNIVSNVVNQTLVNQISKDVLQQFTNAYINIITATK